MGKDLRNRWRVDGGAKVDLEEHDAAATSGAPGDKAETESVSESLHQELRGLQERLWAESKRSMLVILQGIDASGKDGTVSHVFRGLNPLGTRVAAFKAPTHEELSHDFLWRVHARCPQSGEIAIFNRSHYEDVLVAHVHQLVTEKVWRGRYANINSFEALLHDSGTTLVKLFLHVSKDEQLSRLNERLSDKTKQWKISDADFKEREFWNEYNEAFEEMLGKTSPPTAPWHIIPADHKWYRNWAVSTVLIETLKEMNPQYPMRPEHQLENSSAS